MFQSEAFCKCVETLFAGMESEGIEGCCVPVKLKATDSRVSVVEVSISLWDKDVHTEISFNNNNNKNNNKSKKGVSKFQQQ